MTIFGVDLSHYDWTRGPVDVAAMHRSGMQFMTHKLGGDSRDPRFGDWWARARPLRWTMLPGAYWVLYPGRPTARADEFVASLDERAPGWRDGPFILQADCERWNNNPATVPSAADIETFCDRLSYRVPGHHPVVYAPKWVYGDTLAGLRYPLWQSAYGANPSGTYGVLYPGDASSRWRAYSGQVPPILQYSSNAMIGSQPGCDANAYRGTLAELTALVTGDDMAISISDEDAKKVARAVWAADVIPVDGTAWVAGGTLGLVYRKLIELEAQVDALPAAVRAVLGDGPEAAAVEAVVARQLARLRLAAVDTQTA